MKYAFTILTVIIAGATLLTRCSAVADPVSPESVQSSPEYDVQVSLEDFPLESLSTDEIGGLQFMREEEKLARDVYAYFYTLWNHPIFSNISASEQTHTSAVLSLLNRYDLEDPVLDDTAGQLTDSTLNALYQELTQAGAVSLIESLKIGALIEEIDIIDLQHQLDTVVDNEDIRFVYDQLMRGSRNHLRAFVQNLERQGVAYVPQQLDGDVYQSIIDSSSERGNNR